MVEQRLKYGGEKPYANGKTLRRGRLRAWRTHKAGGWQSHQMGRAGSDQAIGAL